MSYFSLFTSCVLLLLHQHCFEWLTYQLLNAFYTILNFHFKYQILYACKLASLCCWKPTQGAFFSRKWVKIIQGGLFSIFKTVYLIYYVFNRIQNCWFSFKLMFKIKYKIFLKQSNQWPRTIYVSLNMCKIYMYEYHTRLNF